MMFLSGSPDKSKKEVQSLDKIHTIFQKTYSYSEEQALKTIFTCNYKRNNL